MVQELDDNDAEAIRMDGLSPQLRLARPFPKTPSGCSATSDPINLRTDMATWCMRSKDHPQTKGETESAPLLFHAAHFPSGAH